MNSFLTGKKSLALSSLRPPAGIASAQAPTAQQRSGSRESATLPAGPMVEVVKDGDKVIRLVVTCACGEKIEVECLYPAGS